MFFRKSNLVWQSQKKVLLIFIFSAFYYLSTVISAEGQSISASFVGGDVYVSRAQQADTIAIGVSLSNIVINNVEINRSPITFVIETGLTQIDVSLSLLESEVDYFGASEDTSLAFERRGLTLTSRTITRLINQGKQQAISKLEDAYVVCAFLLQDNVLNSILFNLRQALPTEKRQDLALSRSLFTSSLRTDSLTRLSDECVQQLDLYFQENGLLTATNMSPAVSNNSTDQHTINAVLEPNHSQEPEASRELDEVILIEHLGCDGPWMVFSIFNGSNTHINQLVIDMTYNNKLAGVREASRILIRQIHPGAKIEDAAGRFTPLECDEIERVFWRVSHLETEQAREIQVSVRDLSDQFEFIQVDEN